MAGRSFPWPILAVLGLVAASATAATPLRVTLPVETTPLEIKADTIFSWVDGGETAYLLRANVEVKHGRSTIRAGRAVVWVNQLDERNRDPVRVQIFADRGDDSAVAIQTTAEPAKKVPSALIDVTTSAVGRLHGLVQPKAMAEDPFYLRALAARGRHEAPADPQPLDLAQFERPKGEPTAKGSVVVPVPFAESRSIRVSPRTTRPFNIVPLVEGTEKALVVTGGVKLLVTFSTGQIRALEVEADRVVLWQKEGDSTKAFDSMRSPEGGDANRVEFYLSGNVVLRYGGVNDKTPAGIQKESRTLRADRVYYDVDKHKAIAINADLEYTREGNANTGHITSPELQQLGEGEFHAMMAELHASRLPSDPGLKITLGEADIYKEPKTERRGLFGTTFRDRITGQPIEEEPTIIEATRVRTLVRDVPVLAWPRIRTNANDPFGPLQGLTFHQNRIFGFQAYATWDLLEIAGISKLKGENWTLLTDYLSRRGPALGTNYQLSGEKFFGMDAPFQTLIKGYVIQDAGTDILGGPRQDDYQPTSLRGRFLLRHVQDLTPELQFQTQLTYLSDRNFYEQYYPFDYMFGPNQETFAWLKYTQGNFAGTFQVQADTGRNWNTETFWLPRVDGYWLGQSIFERFTYHTWANVGWARFDYYRQPTREFPLNTDAGFPPIERQLNTGRVDWMQQIAMPFEAGPAKVVPYGVLDLAYYTENNNGDQQGRMYGGGGVRASMPFSRLYRDVESELFNVNGLYHKNLVSLNYYLAGSSASFAVLPQLDRLNDDATEASVRNVTPWHPYFVQTANQNGSALQTAPQFNPRLYAIRRLVDSKPDTLDDIHTLQFDWRQRFQTKRGYPGLEHTVDWLTVDLSGTFFPTPGRDNFGRSVAFLEGRVQWNVGDRNGLFANGWIDPYDFGARYWEVGTFFYRDDRTSVNFTYKSVDPIQARVVVLASTYVFSPKYAATFITAYDFSFTDSLTNAFLITRVGTDAQVTLGFTYNALVRNVGLTLNIVPNLVASSQTPVPTRGFGGAGGGGGLNQGR